MKYVYAFCLTALTVCVCRWIESAREVNRELVPAARQELQQTRLMAAGAVVLLGGRLDAQVTAARQEVLRILDARSKELSGQIDTRSQEVLELAGTRLDSLRRDVNADLFEVIREAHGVSRSVATVAVPLGSTLDQISKAAPDFLDCDQNASCVYNRWVGLSRSVESMARTWDRNLPAFVAEAQQTNRHIAGITADVNVFTSRFIAPRPLKSKIWDGVKLGIYGAARTF